MFLLLFPFFVRIGYKYILYAYGHTHVEMGYFRILAGHNSLGIELEVAWATPGKFTVHNYPCYEDGSNCVETQVYDDPSKVKPNIIQQRRTMMSTTPKSRNGRRKN